MKFRLSVALSAFMAAALVQAQMSSTSTVPATGGIQVTPSARTSSQRAGARSSSDPGEMMADQGNRPISSASPYPRRSRLFPPPSRSLKPGALS